MQKALQLRPDWNEAANNLAWVLATSADPNCRNGPQAVELAERAYAADPKNFSYSDSLAAAYAEAGRFAQAIEAARRAIALAEAAGQTSSLPRFHQRLELYQAGQPFHEAPRLTTPLPP
jgi:cytochrome c-type biogenesis protein CcmH/NrfG